MIESSRPYRYHFARHWRPLGAKAPADLSFYAGFTKRWDAYVAYVGPWAMQIVDLETGEVVYSNLTLREAAAWTQQFAEAVARCRNNYSKETAEP